jgi:hypothetical protein
MAGWPVSFRSPYLFVCFSLFSCSFYSHGAELESELLALREVADAVAGYVHAHGGRQEERLLDIPNCVWYVVEFDVHRGAAVALMVVQVWLGQALHHLVGLPEGQELAKHDGSREDFNEAADAVVDLVPAEGVIKEATRGLGP